jgi:DNA-directed RNA polymerase
MTKEEFVDWKNHTVTREVFKSLKEKVDELSEDLSQTAGLDSITDRFKTGAIAGYRDLLLIAFEDTE